MTGIISWVTLIVLSMWSRRSEMLSSRGAMLDQWSSLDIISLPILDAVGVPWENITRQRIEVSGLGGDCICVMGFVNPDLTVGRIKSRTGFTSLILRCRTTCCLDNPGFVVIMPSPLRVTMSKSHLERNKGSHQCYRIFVSKRWGSLFRGPIFCWAHRRRGSCSN